MLHETGALISLQPNASKIISALGLDKFLVLAEPMNDRCFRIVNTAGDVVNEIPLDPSMFGADRVLYHRQDLHQGLRDAATSPELPGNPVHIRTAAAVVACDTEAGTVTLGSGEVITADLVIGADGIHSTVRTSVVGEVLEAIPTGISAYRMLIPIEALGGVDVPASVFTPSNPVTTMIVGHDKRIIMGPGRGGKVLGIVALVPDEKMHEKSSTDSWVEEGSKEKLMEAYADFPQWVRDIFDRAPDIGLWQLRDLDPLSTWVKGRAVLIGDAAHPMLPTQGQGASQSVEDGEALQALFANIRGKPAEAQVTGALEKVLKARHERASLIQRYSRQQAKPGTSSGSNKITLDPGQFMKYNCDYNGAEDWLLRQGLSNGNS